MLVSLDHSPGGMQNLDGSCFAPISDYSKDLLDVYIPILNDIKEAGQRLPPFWEEFDKAVTNSTRERNDLVKTSVVPFGPCLLPQNDALSVGPKGYSPKMKHTSNRSSCNICRPGFLIIGSGKCGTSSLYHYIVGHSHAMPAKEKQVHYFTFYYNRGLSWYYSQFPSAIPFVETGALITGEAAPGYLPSPLAAFRARKEMPGTRIILMAREPIDRAWSSYNYNYVRVAMPRLRRRHARLNMTDEEIAEKFLFSFEDMMKAELTVLRECFSTKQAEVSFPWTRVEEQRRKDAGLPPMMDIIGNCYPENENLKASSRFANSQWKELVEKFPYKTIDLPNTHLYEAFIGRGLYALQVEWWYATFPAEDITIVCTEDLKDRTLLTMDELSIFLGLPNYDFSDVVNQGAYNVKGHQGYDKPTSWEETEKQHTNETIPLSPEFRVELQEFFHGHNERLFNLVGRRCPW